MRVGDLVVHRDSWKGYLFLVTEVDKHTALCRCTIVHTPKNDAEYEVGYTIRWKQINEWRRYANESR